MQCHVSRSFSPFGESINFLSRKVSTLGESSNEGSGRLSPMKETLSLRNDEHFQFQTELKGLVEQYTPAALGIEAAWAVYEPLYTDESNALNVIRKSAVTSELAEADHYRDSLYRGICDTVKGATNHYNSAVKVSANRIEIAIDHYGNINVKSYDEQTAAINSLLSDLKNDYAADVSQLNIGEWLIELQTANTTFETLMKERYAEDSGKTQLSMKDVRRQVDEVYRTITERIGALVIVNGEEAYSGFVNELNQRIEKYNNTLALREGRTIGPVPKACAEWILGLHIHDFLWAGIPDERLLPFPLKH
ncbi:hypothetical protein ADUPG1_001572 [Aduncisulcus paluster]|uniref:Uncharacterized protein n=1 Tax=Aduncisulcus paluster TaxID=2918883 RepID=A0ABQ5KDG2_9EUKA|nr:hypothetical protein ADUPG1_001572 [Aduncisulcus paluster]